jgi:tetratricopeptide (TPR) repeat protein
LLAQKGKEAEALKAFDVSLRLNPNDDHVWLNKGDALAALGKYNDAINSYNQVIKRNPNNADAYNNIGQAYFNQGNFEKALKWFNAAITKNPKYSAYVDWKCETLWKLSVNAGGGEWHEKYKTCRDPVVLPVINTPPTKPPQNQPPCRNPSNPLSDCGKPVILQKLQKSDTGY